MKRCLGIIRRIGYRAARRLRLLPPSVEMVTRANTREAYDQLYSRDDLLMGYLDSSRLAFYEEVAGYCAPLCGSRVIDLGCGSGHLLHALDALVKSNGGSAEMFGVDHSPAAIRKASGLVAEGKFSVGDIQATNYGRDVFDLVISTETLEHLPQPDLVLEEAARICRPGGAIVFTVPNGDIDSWEGHMNFWNLGQFTEFLAQKPCVELRELLIIDQGRSLLACLSKGRPASS